MSEAVVQNLDIRSQVTSEEWAIRQDLAAAYDWLPTTDGTTWCLPTCPLGFLVRMTTFY